MVSVGDMVIGIDDSNKAHLFEIEKVRGLRPALSNQVLFADNEHYDLIHIETLYIPENSHMIDFCVDLGEEWGFDNLEYVEHSWMRYLTAYCNPIIKLVNTDVY